MRESKARETLRMYKTSVLVVMAALFLATRNHAFSYIFIFALTQTALGGGLKLLFKQILPKHVWQRPKGAVNCSGYFRVSKKVNPMGFPSGHSMGAFALATLLADYTNFDALSTVLAYGAAFMVALSRGTWLGKFSGGGHGGKPVACHSPLQIAIGSLLGVFYAFFVIKTFPPPWKKTRGTI
jgi:membrane-associated phospholipid phosphatase